MPPSSRPKPRNEVPFVLDRRSPVTLTDQMVDGLRQAIYSNFYKPGDSLPTLNDLAIMCGTSLRIPRMAIERLKKEGLVDPRRALGCFVTGKNRPRWRGHVLFVIADVYGSYYATVFTGLLQEILMKAGYLFTSIVTIDKSGRPDPAILEAALTQNVTFGVSFCAHSAETRKAFKAREVPFAEIGREFEPGAKGLIRFERGAALGDFVAHCREAGVRKVLQVCFDGEGDIDAAPALEAAGIAVRKEVFSPPSSYGRLEEIQRMAMNRISDMIVSGERFTDEVILFTDDFLANGGLMGLARHGLRAPEDVKVVSFANAGYGPVYFRELTRFEMNPNAHAQITADSLLQALDGGKMPENVALKSVYRRGETF